MAPAAEAAAATTQPAEAKTAPLGLSLWLPPLCMPMPVLTSRYVPSSFSMSAFLSFSSPPRTRRPMCSRPQPHHVNDVGLSHRIRGSGDGGEPATTRAANHEAVELLLRSVPAGSFLRSRRRGFSNGSVEALSDQRVAAGDQARAPEPQHVMGARSTVYGCCLACVRLSSRLFATSDD